MEVNWDDIADAQARRRGIVPSDLEDAIIAAYRAGHSADSRPSRGRRRMTVTNAQGRKIEIEYVLLGHPAPSVVIYVQDVAVDLEAL